MRAAVLALVLIFVTPPVVWQSAPEASLKAGASALASPANTASTLVRSAAKVDKTLSTDAMATLAGRPLHTMEVAAVARVDALASLDRLELDVPPLAPRPPPLG
jgi:hypothetical protein